MPEAAPFADPAGLAKRLGVDVWTGAELDQVTELLADASDHLRSIIGWQVWPPVQVTTRVPTGALSPVALAGAPVTAVESVTRDGADLPSSAYELADGSVAFYGTALAGSTITYTVGYPTLPRELVRWTCVLASQALSVLGDLGALGTGNLASLAVGEVRKAWHSDGSSGGLPERVQEQLRARYGAGGAAVTGA